jgi:hypothetical protein
MKFPITRESLQAFDPVKEHEERMEEEIQTRYAQMVDIICKEVQRSMRTSSKEKKYVWRNLHLVRSLPTLEELYTGIYCPKTTNIDEHLPRFVEKLRETFIGCDIIIDPLKTYLIIDWS